MKKVNLAKGLAIAAGGGAALGGATFGISKLVKSSGNDKKDEPSPETNQESDKPTDSKEEEKEPDKKNEPSPETNPEPDKPTGSKKEEKEPDKKDEPSPETNPEPDKPTGSEEEEKEPEKKEEKNPSEKPKEEEKGGFGEWYKNNLGVSIPLTFLLTLLSVYFFFIIVYTVVNEIRQQKDMSEVRADGICLEFASGKDGGSIKPLFGRFKYFTNKDRFEIDEGWKDKYDKEYTITYSGLKRIGINVLAAVTLAVDYQWYYSKPEVGLTPK